MSRGSWLAMAVLLLTVVLLAFHWRAGEQQATPPEAAASPTASVHHPQPAPTPSKPEGPPPAAIPSPTPAGPVLSMLDWADSLENQRNLDETLRLCLDAAARGEAEGYRCLFEANLGCRNSTGLDRADLLALAERQMAEATAASDDREYRRHLRCKALWQQQPPSLDAQHWFDEGFKARDPSVVVNKLLGPSACNSGLGLEQRRAMVAEAWLKGDLEAATQIESHALDVEGDQGAGTPPTFDPAMTAHTAICKDKPSSSCIAYLRRLGELCAPPLCIAQGSLLDRIQTFFSPAIAEEARQYSERLRDHLHRGDTQWPALQRVLQSMRDC